MNFSKINTNSSTKIWIWHDPFTFFTVHVHTKITFFPNFFVYVQNYASYCRGRCQLLMKYLLLLSEAFMKKISAVEGKPFTSSLNIFPEARKRGGGVTSPPPRHRPISQMIRGKDDVTVILLLGISFMEANQSIQQFSYMPVCFKLRHDYRKPIQHNAHMKACTVQW